MASLGSEKDPDRLAPWKVFQFIATVFALQQMFLSRNSNASFGNAHASLVASSAADLQAE